MKKAKNETKETNAPKAAKSEKPVKASKTAKVKKDVAPVKAAKTNATKTADDAKAKKPAASKKVKTPAPAPEVETQATAPVEQKNAPIEANAAQGEAIDNTPAPNAESNELTYEMEDGDAPAIEDAEIEITQEEYAAAKIDERRESSDALIALPEYIHIELFDGQWQCVKADSYVKAKTGDLKELGYTDLTEAQTAAQLLKVLNGDTDLDVIGMFIVKDMRTEPLATAALSHEKADTTNSNDALLSRSEIDALENISDDERQTLYHLRVGDKMPLALAEKFFAGEILAPSESLSDELSIALNEALDETGERNANASETEMLAMSNARFEALKESDGDLSDFRELTPTEKTRLEFYEQQIENGLKSYVSVGKYLFAVFHEGLFEGTWSNYLKTRWKGISRTGAYDLMRAYRTWRLASSTEQMTFSEAVAPDRWLASGQDETAATETVHDALPVFDDEAKVSDASDTVATNDEAEKGEQPVLPASDSDAPSQRAIEELGKITNHLDFTGMTESEVERFEKNAVRWLWDAIRRATGGNATQKAVSEALEAYVEFAASKAFEIDGEQIASASDFRISKGLFEQLQRDKQSIREILESHRKRLSEAQERTHNEFTMTATPEAIARGNFDAQPPDNFDELETPHLYALCSKCGWQKIHRFMFGAVQLKCGHVFGMPKGQDEVLFNPVLTADNPIED